MYRRIGTVVSQIKRPAYTGSNRCAPCTILNVAIAGIVGVALTTVSTPVGVIVFLLCLVVIYLRGYLVPGTPTITVRYLPDRILGWFGKGENEHALSTIQTKTIDSNDGSYESIEEVLEAANVITECETADDLCLTDEFREKWSDRIETIDGSIDEERFASSVGIDTDRVSIDETDLVFIEIGAGRKKQWGSQGATVADIAASEVLSERIEAWYELPLETRQQLLDVLRIFLDRCPLCTGSLEIFQEHGTTGCCPGGEKYTIRCDECSELLASIDPT